MWCKEEILARKGEEGGKEEDGKLAEKREYIKEKNREGEGEVSKEEGKKKKSIKRIAEVEEKNANII